MTKKAINQRFINYVNLLISERKVKSKAVVAEKVGIKPSKLSEILNNRMNVGMDTIALFCDSYGVSAEWILLGKETEVEVVKKTVEAQSIAELVNSLLEYTDQELTQNKTWGMFLNMHNEHNSEIIKLKRDLKAAEEKLADKETNKS